MASDASTPSCAKCGRVKLPASDNAESIEWDFGWGTSTAYGVRCPKCRSHDYIEAEGEDLELRSAPTLPLRPLE